MISSRLMMKERLLLIFGQHQYRTLLLEIYNDGGDKWSVWRDLYNAGYRGDELNGFLRHPPETSASA